MKRIRVLTELYFPEKTSTAYFLTEIAQGLAQKYSVRVITGDSMYETKSAPLPQYEVISHVEIQRCNGTAFNKNHLLGKLINGCSRSVSIFLNALQHCHTNDVVLVVTNPPLLPLVALLLKFFKGCDFVLLVHDVYPEVLAASGLSRANTPIYRGVQWMNCLIYRKASRVVTLGRDMTKLAYAKLSPDEGPSIVCIPNWAETETIYPLSKQTSPLLQQLNLIHKFVVLYAGNMGRTHDLPVLLAAAEVLAKEQSNIHFLFIGSGARKKWLEIYVQEHQLPNVTVLPYLPHDEKNVALNACDLGIISFLPGMAGVSVPSRMYNQMAAGKPIVAISDDWSELAQVVTEEQIGWVVPPGDRDTLLQVLRSASQQSIGCAQMGKKAAAVVQAKYTLGHAVAAYQSMFDQVFSPSIRQIN